MLRSYGHSNVIWFILRIRCGFPIDETPRPPPNDVREHNICDRHEPRWSGGDIKAIANGIEMRTKYAEAVGAAACGITSTRIHDTRHANKRCVGAALNQEQSMFDVQLYNMRSGRMRSESSI